MARRIDAESPDTAQRTKLLDAAPWIVVWTGEPAIPGEIIARSNGIAYVDEIPADRGRHGELLRRGVRPVQDDQRGKPLFADINHAKQRRALRLLLCQVCAEPAGCTEAGTLWILTVDAYEKALEIGFVQAPVCLPCARIAVEVCPRLRAGHVALRARAVRPTGVVGTLCAPNPNPLNPNEIRVVERDYAAYFHDPLLPWVLASEIRVELSDVTVVDLDEDWTTQATNRPHPKATTPCT